MVGTFSVFGSPFSPQVKERSKSNSNYATLCCRPLLVIKIVTLLSSHFGSLELFQIFIHAMTKKHPICCEIQQDIRHPQSKDNLVRLTDA